MALTDKLKAIANAIRAKTGQTGTLTLDAMPTAIAGISSGATEPYVEETYDANGNLTAAVLHGHTVVRDGAFWRQGKLVTVDVGAVTSLGAAAFYNCDSLSQIQLPEVLETIKDDAFNWCQGLTSIVLPASIQSIGYRAFNYCIKLKTVTFRGTPETIRSNAFDSYPQTINVPWAEGEVAKAPWGATNATINYNYTGEEAT